MSTSKLKLLADAHASTDYADPESVARCNRAATEIRAMLGSLESEQLAKLLKFGPARSWTAYFVLEREAELAELAPKALAVIRGIACGPGVQAFAARAILEKHEAGT